MARDVPVFIGIMASLFIIAQTTELRPYITKENLTCLECPPGFYFSGDCTRNNTIAVCEVCPQGYYSSVPGVHTSCARCSPFCESVNLIVVSKCSPTTNLTCDCPQDKVLKNKHDKHHAICEDPPTHEPPKTTQNCADDTEEKHNVSIYNQTQADPGSGTVEDVEFSHLNNYTCPAQDKCVDSKNCISVSDRVIFVSFIVFSILIILCMFVICNTQCRDKLKSICRCKGKSGINTDRVPDPANDKLMTEEGNQGDVSKKEDSHRVEMDNDTNNEQIPTNGSVPMPLDNTHASHDESVQHSPTSTMPPSIILPSAIGTVAMETVIQ